jgi:CRISPR-associated protein Csm1
MLRYTVNRVPQMTFDELQKAGATAYKRLGVLRMDVDNLGNIFSDGLGAVGDPGNRLTLARLSTLSFQISLFFEGWVKKLCEARGGKIYAVYAGGDDLFLIGPWEIMPALARQISEDFSRYTAGHPGLHLSGGMAFIGGKYPVYQAAQDAEEAETQAKNRQGKNAFSFLGKAWSWQEFESLAQKQERLVRLVSKSATDSENLGGPQAILGVLQQLAASEARAAGQAPRPVWGPWLWMGAYQLTRMAERYQKHQPELAREIESIREELAANYYADIQIWGTAARWAQLATRKSTERDTED